MTKQREKATIMLVFLTEINAGQMHHLKEKKLLIMSAISCVTKIKTRHVVPKIYSLYGILFHILDTTLTEACVIITLVDQLTVQSLEGLIRVIYACRHVSAKKKSQSIKCVRIDVKIQDKH